MVPKNERVPGKAKEKSDFTQTTNAEFASLDRKFADEHRESERDSKKIEKIAQGFLSEINAAISDYWAKRNESTAKAEAVFKTVIVPWLKDLDSSGRLAKLLSQDRRQIEIAREIYYPREQSITRNFIDAEGQVTSKSISQHIEILRSLGEIPKKILTSLQRSLVRDSSDSWHAVISLEKKDRGEYELVITPWHTVGTGFGYALAVENYRIHIPFNELEDYFADVHSKIWLGLAEWISSGQTVKHIKKEILRPKHA